MYRIVRGSKGVRYMKDGKLIAKAKVPAGVLEELDKAEVAENKSKAIKACLFCGSAGRFQRFVNLTNVDLCEDDYWNQNVGKIAEKLRTR